MKFFGSRSAVFIFALAPLLARAGGDEVVVVYNTRMPESKAVAEYYARMRQVPEKQIYGFALTASEEMSRSEFRDSLQKPLVAKLESDGLWKFAKTIVTASNGLMHVEYRLARSKIRYAVLCHGVPLKIAADPNLHELAADNLPPDFRRNEAAVDSELAWLPLSKNEMTLSGPLPDWVYGATNKALLNPTNGILLVARLDGPNADIARGLVDKALAAERDGLWGRA
ncbi:MAG: TIGR03790 family protein, partial [Verrucomicrobiota bacterium]